MCGGSKWEKVVLDTSKDISATVGHWCYAMTEDHDIVDNISPVYTLIVDYYVQVKGLKCIP